MVRGGAAPVELDEAVHAGDGESPGAIFEAEWLRHLMQLAVDELDAQLTKAGKPVHVALFRQFHIGDDAPSYAAAAEQHDRIPPIQFS